MAGHNVLGRIASIMEDLPKAEKKIAEVILHSPETIVNMTASQLGTEAKSSAATVIRLCKRLGVESFTQLKVMVSGEISHTSPTGYADITADEKIDDIMDKLLGNAFQSMQDTVSILNKDRLFAAVDALEKASVIYVFGIGASQLVAQNIAQKWSRIGKTCVCPNDPHNLVAALAGSDENTVFFGISNSGETKEVSKIVQIAKDNGCTTIGLTRFGGNTIASKVDVSLQTVRAKEEELRSAATSSLHAQFLVVDVLFYTYASRNYDRVIQNTRHSRAEIDHYSNN
ncbi:MurR/RpiR family transcriptional regulator [Atopococcus tabaci]|uniref:MurR/RpiR family transcriptional regulator n=1 Tax=Atopococcus tabaci TaxID=269774 RepID=UPI000412DB50|nr:MurR/RpiR family transcriptional regulator [Atopococcus tabaci]